MNRDQKQEMVAQLKGAFEEADLMVVAHYKGLTVTDMNNLRAKIGKVGADFRVTKNRLTRIALAGGKFEKAASLFTGPTAVATSKDPVAAAKAAVEFAKENDKLVILGGSLNGEFLDSNAVKTLATLPSLDEVRAKLVGLLATPATRLATVAQAPAAQLARVFSAYAKKDEAA